jgi:hypothetical protein
VSRIRLMTIRGGPILLRAGLTCCEVDVRTGESGTTLKAAFAVDPRLPVALTAVFAALKLAHVTDWAWWAVTAPLWCSVMLAVMSAGFVMLVATRRPSDEGSRDGR